MSRRPNVGVDGQKDCDREDIGQQSGLVSNSKSLFSPIKLVRYWGDLDRSRTYNYSPDGA